MVLEWRLPEPDEKADVAFERCPVPTLMRALFLPYRPVAAAVTARNVVRVNRALIVCGPSGVGKSSVAAEILGARAGHATPCASVDVDTVAQFGPAPWRRRGEVSFHDMLKCKNVGSLWRNFRDAGALYLVVAAKVDSLQLRVEYEKALKGCALQVALLTAPPELVRERLLGRPRDLFHPKTYADDGAVRQEVLEGVAAEQARLQAARAHDFSVTNDAAPGDAAARALELAGWPG